MKKMTGMIGGMYDMEGSGDFESSHVQTCNGEIANRGIGGQPLNDTNGMQYDPSTGKPNAGATEVYGTDE